MNSITDNPIKTMLTFDEASPDRYGMMKLWAHQNRLNMTDAESFLWEHLRCSFLGHRFLRQYIIGDYIVDFVCRDQGLIIEVDGAYHCEPRQVEDDAIRQKWLESKGYHVMRFTNEGVLFTIEDVLYEITEYFE